MQQQHDVLNKKLKQAIDARTVVEDARKHQVEVLSQFAAKLSLSCKGLDIELDNRLAKFRNALKKGVNFELLTPLSMMYLPVKTTRNQANGAAT